MQMKAFVSLTGGGWDEDEKRGQRSRVCDGCFYVDKHSDVEMNESSEADAPIELVCGGGGGGFFVVFFLGERVLEMQLRR